jgi:hypothetical protein
MNKKIKFFFLKKNPIDLYFIDFINAITIEDFVIINNDETVYNPKEILFLRSEAPISNKVFDIYIEDNKIGENVLGAYTQLGDALTWNKGEGNFINFDINSCYEIRGNTLKLELIDQQGMIFNLESKRLSIILIVSYEFKK